MLDALKTLANPEFNKTLTSATTNIMELLQAIHSELKRLNANLERMNPQG